MKKGLLLSLILFSFITFSLPYISFSQTSGNLQPPENFNQFKEEAQNTGKTVLQNLPEAVKKIWDNEVLPLWEKMWWHFKVFWKKTLDPYLNKIWYSYLKPKITKIILKIEKMAEKKIEEKKPQIQKEFQKKKEETKKEIERQAPKATETILEKLKEILK